MRSARLLLALLIVMTGATLSQPSPAHPGGHGRDAALRMSLARQAFSEIERLITAGKLELSWNADTTLESVEADATEPRKWVVTFSNPKAKKTAERTLHVVLSESGEVLATSFTGS
jgi:hypothetical protein